MVKGGKVSSTRKFRTRVRSEYKGSDDSDEDYVISDEENEVSEELEEEYCSSAEGVASEESFGNFVEEEEDEEEVIKVRKRGRSRARRGSDRFVVDEEDDEEEVIKARKNGRSRGRKGSDSFVDDEEEDEDEEEVIKVRNNSRSRGRKGSDSFVDDEEEDEDEDEVIKVRNNSRSRGRKGSDNFVVDEEEDEEEVMTVRNNSRSRAKKGSDSSFVDEEEEEEEEEEEDEEEMKQVRGVRSKVQNGFSGRQKNGVNPSRKRRKVTYQEDQDYDDGEDDDDDEEFTPDEDDFSELEEKPVVKRRKTTVKVGKRRLRKKDPVRGAKRRKPLAPKKPWRKKGRNNRAVRRNVRCDDDHESDGDFMDSILPVREQNEKKRVRKRRRLVVPSDSDFVSSGSSDCDYTISEEEREQVREARELCENSKTNLRSSLVSTNIQEEKLVQQPRKVLRRKGKEKIEPVKVEVVKQVCGICLSEEDKRRVRGTLDCCTHYFCFSCIMEWGKVESRCPLCKQRFKTISKPGRSTGIDLREVVIQVPERDQVYQPTEEELRSYLDPYENVICTECHEGGEDGLMLLCDLCDSPAHTYCVGLGREVPEGNWYCEGCRPVAMGSSSSQVQGHFSDQRSSTNILSNRPSPVGNFDEGVEIDLNSMASPRSHINQGFVIPPSPRFPVGGFQAASPVAVAGLPTLSRRRELQRHIQQMFHASRTSHLASRTERNSSVNLSNDFLNSQVGPGRETTVQHTRTDEIEASYHTFFEERLQFNPLTQVQDNDFFSSMTSQLGRQVIQDPTTTSADRSLNGALWPELTEMNSASGDGQYHHFSSRPNIGSDGGVSPNIAIEQSDFHIAKEQLKVMVKHHLDNLSRDIYLEKDTFKDIARRSTHTVLAVCGHEHRSNEVVDVPPPSACSHIELVVGGKTSLMRGCCSSCFESFVRDVVKRILDSKPPHWLNLGL